MLDGGHLAGRDAGAGGVEARACRALWCAVIQEQLRLALLRRPSALDRAYEIRAARGWFGSRDFYQVCALAGLDGGWVLRGVGENLTAKART